MGTKEVPIKEAVRIGYHENSTYGSDEAAERFRSSRDFRLSKATKALEAAGFDVTPIEGSPYEFLVTKKAKSSPDAGTQATPSSLDNLGIDFQTATMDANDTRLPTPGAFTGEFQKIMEGAKDWKEVQDRLKGQTVTYFDFETTGIADYDGQDITNDPVQLGAVQVKDGKIVKRFNVYTNPESKLSEWSSKKLGRDILDEDGNRILDENGKPKTTLVTPEWLAEQASQEQALRDFIDFIGPNALLGGQNVPFDVEILKRMAGKYGIELDIAGTIDSKDLASLLPKYDPEKGIDGPKQIADVETGRMRPSSSLGPVANFLGFEPANWHSADGDAEDSYNLVSKIIDRAAKEENQDLSLLDFPLMQKRYEERMAEFKDVVSPNNPITQRQENALDRFTVSKNLNIAAIANKALKTAKTRGEAAEVLKNLHMLENQKAPEASESELESLFGYRKNLYKTINKHLRKPESDRKNSPKLNATIADIDNLIEKQAPTAEAVTVFRGLSGPAAERLRDAAVGDVFTEPGFSSTSGDIQTMWGFAYGTGNVGAELHLTLPPGSKFIDVDNYIPEQMGPMEISRESEALLPRGIKFRIDDVSDNVITATVLPESDNVLPDIYENQGPEGADYNADESDPDFSSDSPDQEALEEAYKELRAANRVQMMEPKASANKKLNDDDYTVMDILRFGPVMVIDDIKREAEDEKFSSGGSLSKTIASLKRKGILTAVPGDKEKLALTESGIEKVAAVQAGRAKERRDAEERSQALREKAAADIAAKEAAKTPEQKAQEEANLAKFRANQAALDKKRLAEAEEKRLFYETNLTFSEEGAIKKFLQDALLDGEISNIGEGSTFDIETFKAALEDSFEQQPRLPEGQTPVSLTEEIMSSLKKKGFVTTVRGDKEVLALTKLGAEKVRESLGLPSNAEPTFEVSENEGPSSQKLVMPEPEDGGSNKTVEAGTLFKKINSLKKMIENGEELQTYLKSRGKEEDPDMAKLLKMHYRELKGLEFIEAYRKQTGKDRVSAPWSVFDGTHPMFEENPSSITVSESNGPESSGTQTSGAPEFNSDESDSDFDDVEVQFDVPKATAAPDYSVTTSAIDDLIEKYAPTIATTQEVNEYTLIKLGMLVNEVNDAAENYKQTQDAGDKKLYMDKLLEMLDLRSGIIHTANSYSLSNRDSVADSKISGDPLLSPSELALINSKITPRLANGSSFTPRGPVSKRGEQLRREASVKTMTQFLAGLAAKDAKAPKISGLPENWKPYGLVQAFDEALSRKNNLDKIGAIREALKKVQLWENDAVVSFRDSTGAYPGVLRVGKGKSSGLAATPTEIRTIVASVSNFGEKINMNVGAPSHYDMFITPSGGAKDHPLRRLWVSIGMMRKSKPTTLAYSSELTGTVFYMDKIRNSQKEHDSGASKNDGRMGSWWAIEIRPNSSDVLDSTVNHEFGHATHDAAFIDTSKEMSGKIAPSRYGAESNNEKFAEYMSKYIRTGDAPPWFIDLLRSKGLLKSQQN